MKLMTTEEAAEAAGVTVSAVRMAILRKRLRSTRFGKAHMIAEADFEEWRENTRAVVSKEIDT
jgi:excisionase family DNA binding protein